MLQDVVDQARLCFLQKTEVPYQDQDFYTVGMAAEAAVTNLTPGGRFDMFKRLWDQDYQQVFMDVTASSTQDLVDQTLSGYIYDQLVEDAEVKAEYERRTAALDTLT